MPRPRKPLTIIMAYVLDQLGPVEEIKNVEENAEDIWINYKDGTVKSILIHNCEPNESTEVILAPRSTK